jgi:inorganic pyrophosphatase
MIVITSGARYIDIDAYACCVAYAELLNLLGKPAVAVSTAPWNESITQSIRDLHAPFSTGYNPAADDQFVIVDLSEPAQFDTIVQEEQVIEIIDHHPGFEQYWSDKIGQGSHIEFIGAAATLVYEQWVAADKAGQMSNKSAELLAAAILDNTLNFGAGVTTDRDKDAYAQLTRHAGLSDGWRAAYFTECQQTILADLPEALRNDTKFLDLGPFQKLCVGQLVVWDARSILSDHLQTISSVLGDMQDAWITNVVSISEGKSYFVSQDDAVRTWAQQLLHVTFDGPVATADRLWLRKEIIKADQSA